MSKYGAFSVRFYCVSLRIQCKCGKTRTLRIQCKCGKTRTRKNSVFGHFSRSVISEDQAVAEVFSKFFFNIVPNLKITTDHGYDNDFIATIDQVTNAVNKFRNNSSIIIIKNKKKNDQSFSYGPVTYDDVLKKVKTLDTAQKSLSNLIFHLKF